MFAEAIDSYRSSTGKAVIDLSGQDSDVISVQDIRAFQSQYVASPDLSYHRRSNLSNLNHFCEGMIRLHARFILDKYPHLSATPCSGIQSALAAIFSRAHRLKETVSVPMAYFPPHLQRLADGFDVRLQALPAPREGRLLDLDAIESLPALEKSAAPLEGRRTLVIDCPGVFARSKALEIDWREMIEFALHHDWFLVVNGAWSALRGMGHFPFALVAKEYPDLRWAELYSVSRTFSDPGARLGVVIGSRREVDSIVDQLRLWDGGPIPSLTAAYGEFLKDFHRAGKVIEDLATLYKARSAQFLKWLEPHRCKISTVQGAHFFVAVEAQPGTSFANSLTLVREKGILSKDFTPEGRSPTLTFSLGRDILSPKLRSELELRFAL